MKTNKEANKLRWQIAGLIWDILIIVATVMMLAIVIGEWLVLEKQPNNIQMLLILLGSMYIHSSNKPDEN